MGSLNQHTLAHMLAPFGIAPRVMRIGGKPYRGYERGWFADAFARYAAVTPVTTVTPLTAPAKETPERRRWGRESPPKREAPVIDTLQPEDGRPPKPTTLRFDRAYLAQNDEPDDDASFWEVRVETGHMDMRVKGFANRDDAEAYLKEVRDAGEVTI